MKTSKSNMDEAKAYSRLALNAYLKGDEKASSELNMLAMGALAKDVEANGSEVVEAIMPDDVGDGGGAKPGEHLMSDPPGIQNEFPEMQDVPESDQSGDPVRKPLASVEKSISNVVAYLAKSGFSVGLDNTKEGFTMTIAYDDMDHDNHEEDNAEGMGDTKDDPHGKSETWSSVTDAKAVLNANAVLAKSRGDHKQAKQFQDAAALLGK